MAESGLVRCSACSQHIKATETVCPFCGAAQSATGPSAPPESMVTLYGLPPASSMAPLYGAPPTAVYGAPPLRSFEAPPLPAYGLPPSPAVRVARAVFVLVGLAIAGALAYLWLTGAN